MHHTLEQARTFEANPGGAPCNVLAMLAKLGHACAFVGKVGRDMFGAQLRQAAEEAGISMAALVEDPEIHTTLAFAKTLPGGDRDFSFYRSPGADMALKTEEVPAALLAWTRVFHFGSLSLTDEPVRSATRQAVAMAREAGALISFDPNLRPQQQSRESPNLHRAFTAFSNFQESCSDEICILLPHPPLLYCGRLMGSTVWRRAVFCAWVRYAAPFSCRPQETNPASHASPPQRRKKGNGDHRNDPYAADSFPALRPGGAWGHGMAT